MGTEGDGDWEGDEDYEGYYDNDLNAVKGAKCKGKGNGKGKNNLQCYRCKGHGHMAFQCPTPEDSQAEHLCLQCGGEGQFARDHFLMPKGKGKGDTGIDALKVKGKGKDKGGYKG